MVGGSRTPESGPRLVHLERTVGPAAQLPREPVRCDAPHAHEALVDAAQVVRRAQADQIRRLVAAAPRAVEHVVDVSGGARAARNLAAAAIAFEDAAVRGLGMGPG